MKELNKKIAEWLGWEFHSDGVHWRINPRILGWSILENLPDFPNDIRACFEHIAPKLTETVLKDDRLGVEVMFSAGIVYDGKDYFSFGDTISLAFCLAVEKLIDEST